MDLLRLTSSCGTLSSSFSSLKRPKPWVLVLLANALAAGPVDAATLFVSPTGADSNPGSSTFPFRTIPHAINRAQPGDTIVVKPGRYSEHRTGYGVYISKSGNVREGPITLKSESRWAAVIDLKNASTANNVLWMSGSYLVIDGFELTGGPYGGIHQTGSNNKIINNKIHHNGTISHTTSIGLIRGGDGIVSSNSARGNAYIGNLIYDNGSAVTLDHGLYLGEDDLLIANNIIVRSASWGLQIAGATSATAPMSNVKIYNNLFASNGQDGIILWKTMDGIEIKNNIFYRNRKAGVGSYRAFGRNVSFDRNAFFENPQGTINANQAGSNLQYSIGITHTFDPLFVNPAAQDFRLRNQSRAIDSGQNLRSEGVRTDFDGQPRPSNGPFEIGPFEFGNGSRRWASLPTGLRIR